MRNRRIDAFRSCVAFFGILGVGAVLVGADPPPSMAQAPLGTAFGIPASQQINNPSVSPYLTLTQPGINPAVAYQTLVTPQLQLGNTVLAQQQQLGTQQQQIGTLQQGLTQSRVTPQLAVTPELATGHPIYFLNTLGYFPVSKLGR